MAKTSIPNTTQGPITAFRGPYAFLSNFAPAEVRLHPVTAYNKVLGSQGLVYDELVYPTVEHAYQAAKFMRHEGRLLIWAAAHAGQAKKLGRSCAKLPVLWDEMRLDLMLLLLRQKFAHAELRAKLLATDPYELVEGNWWGDTYWGVCNGVGENHLGLLLMRVRGEIKAAQQIAGTP